MQVGWSHKMLQICLIGCILCAKSGSIEAQNGNQATLSLEDCVRLGLAAPSQVRIAQEQQRISQRGVNIAVAALLPRVTLENGFTYNSPALRQPGSISFVALNGIHEYQSVANTALELDTSGRLTAGVARAQADRDAANTRLRMSERDLRRQITSSFYRLELARKLVDLDRQSLGEAKAFEDKVGLLAANGEASNADLARATAERALIQQVLENAVADSDTSNHELLSYWTTDVTQPLQLTDIWQENPMPLNPLNGGAPYLLRPEFTLLSAERRGLVADSHRARAGLLPQTSLSFEYGIDSLRVAAQDRGYAGFIHLSIPVFDWFSAWNGWRQSSLVVKQSDSAIQMAQRTLNREYQDALTRVENFQHQIDTAHEQVSAGEASFNLSRIRFDAGEGSALEVVTAQEQLTQARTNYYTARTNYLNSLADLALAEGK